MLDVYVCRGPNPLKILIFLEEVPLEHRKCWIDLTLGEHREPNYLKISPGAKSPAIVDHAPHGGGQPISVFESAAILLYLAEKSGRLLPMDLHGRFDAIKWTVWQAASLGPMAGQVAHFNFYAPSGNDYARKRYYDETVRLYAVLEHQLSGRDYIAGEYSIADLACFPWIAVHRATGIDLQASPNLQRWLARVAERPAVARAQHVMNEEAPAKRGTAEQFRKNLFHDHCDPAADAVMVKGV